MLGKRVLIREVAQYPSATYVPVVAPLFPAFRHDVPGARDEGVPMEAFPQKPSPHPPLLRSAREGNAQPEHTHASAVVLSPMSTNDAPVTVEVSAHRLRIDIIHWGFIESWRRGARAYYQTRLRYHESFIARTEAAPPRESPSVKFQKTTC